MRNVFFSAVLCGAVACGGGGVDKDDDPIVIEDENAQPNAGLPQNQSGTPQFDPQTCVTNVGGTLFSCYRGEGNAEGITFHFAEVPQLDEFGQTYLHRYFYTEDAFGSKLCADSFGSDATLGPQLGIPGASECSVTRVWDQSQPGYQTFDAAFCTRPDRTEASFIVEPFQSPPFQVIYGPFTNTCEQCVPDVNSFCTGAI